MVDPWYFGTLQIPVESGRGIEDRDRAGAPPVMVINQEVARNLSRKFGFGESGWTNRCASTCLATAPIPESRVNVQIVGVIRSERTGGLHAPLEPVAYVPLAQVPQQDINLVVRTQIEPLALMSGIREAVRQVDPNLPLGGREDDGTGEGAEHALGEAAHLGGGSLRRRCRTAWPHWDFTAFWRMR